MITNELVDIFYRIINQYSLTDKKSKTYANGLKLYRSEVHTIDAIGRNQNVNITSLAKLQGITKGAVSQMITKLINKGLVIKEISPETENEVIITLSSTGEKIFKIHAHSHLEEYMKLSSYLQSLNEEEVNNIGDFLNIVEEIIRTREETI